MVTPIQLKMARTGLGLSQAQVAEAAGLSTTAYNQIEQAQSDPRTSTLLAIKTALEDRGAVFGIDGGVRIGAPLAEYFVVPEGATGDREATTLAMAIVNLQRRRLGLRPFILDEDD
jgi:transcriptional regulator with XRE-family HTH domain